MWNSCLIVSSILSVKINRTVVLSHHDLSVVLRENFEFDYFTVNPPETFKGELWSVVYLYLWSIDACSDYVSLIFGNLNLIGSDRELKILNEFNSSSILFIISKRFVGFFGFFEKLIIRFPCRHIVSLHSIDLCDFVHQQSYIIALTDSLWIQKVNIIEYFTSNQAILPLYLKTFAYSASEAEINFCSLYLLHAKFWLFLDEHDDDLLNIMIWFSESTFIFLA